jgi:hypothetical protein
MNEQDPNEPIPREEYERRHLALQVKYDSFARRSQRILAALVVAVLLTGGVSAYLLHENAKRTEDINNTLVENCERNGNPLRGTVRLFGDVLVEKTADDIRQSLAFEQSGTYAEIFPTFPPDKLHTLLVENRESERKEIKQLKRAAEHARPVDCDKHFH